MNNLTTIQIEIDLGVNSHDESVNKDGKGRVYIIESDGCIKIGKTKNITQRINTLRNQSGRKFQRACYTDRCKNYSGIEAKMHKELEEYRTFGEWFNIDFDQALEKLSAYSLDVSDVKKNQPPATEAMSEICAEFVSKEINAFLNERPAFRDYLKANGFRVYFYECSKEFLVTNDDDVEMSLMLFLAIYKSQTV